MGIWMYNWDKFIVLGHLNRNGGNIGNNYRFFLNVFTYLCLAYFKIS